MAAHRIYSSTCPHQCSSSLFNTIINPPWDSRQAKLIKSNETREEQDEEMSKVATNELKKSQKGNDHGQMT